MFTKQVLSAVVALGMAGGALAAQCTDPTLTISNAADATAVAACTSVANVVVDPLAGTTIDISGTLKTISGELTVSNNGQIISLTSSSIQKITKWTMKNTTLLSTLRFDRLTEIDTVDWQSLNALPSLTFPSSVTTANSVSIADTFLQSLDGLNLAKVDTLTIVQNKRMTKFESSLASVGTLLKLDANGMNLSVSLPNLIWAANLTIANVTSFSAPSLAVINGSMRFDSSYFESFKAPNLTEAQTSDVTFISCPYLTNITLSKLKRVGGSLTIANNTALQTIDGLGSLQEVDGAVAIRGVLNKVLLPSINDVKGAFDIASTGNISDSCAVFSPLAVKNGGNKIQGDYSCSSSNQNALNNTSSGGTTSGGTGTGNTKSAASSYVISLSTVVSLASLGALFVVFM